MKRIAVAVMVLVFILTTGAYAIEGATIHNGVTLGMSPAEVRALEQKDGEKNSVPDYLFGTLLGQSDTLLIFNYASTRTEAAHFDAYEGSDDEVALRLFFDRAKADIRLDLFLSAPKSGWYSDENSDMLIQVHAIFTTDMQYGTAQNTFKAVEEKLKKIYGATVFADQSGRSFPLYRGWAEAGITTAMSIMPITQLKSKGYSVPYYSHRIAKISDSAYMVIDHHIYIYETAEKGNFEHEIVYTLVPWDISGGYAVDCAK